MLAIPKSWQQLCLIEPWKQRRVKVDFGLIRLVTTIAVRVDYWKCWTRKSDDLTRTALGSILAKNYGNDQKYKLPFRESTVWDKHASDWCDLHKCDESAKDCGSRLHQYKYDLGWFRGVCWCNIGKGPTTSRLFAVWQRLKIKLL